MTEAGANEELFSLIIVSLFRVNFFYAHFFHIQFYLQLNF